MLLQWHMFPNHALHGQLYRRGRSLWTPLLCWLTSRAAPTWLPFSEVAHSLLL